MHKFLIINIRFLHKKLNECVKIKKNAYFNELQIWIGMSDARN